MWIVFESRDGSTTVLSEEFGVTYHSKYGAIQESRHVFIKEGLHAKCIGQKELSILEVGFGTGLNALLTCLEAEKLSLKINYTAIEPNPVPDEIIKQLNFCEKLKVENGHCVLHKLHGADWEKTTILNSQFSFAKYKQGIESVALNSFFDIIYYDAFAPNAQPELWGQDLMQKMYEALLPGGILVTYCAKGIFKRTLNSVGFKVETLKGPPGKREMIRAIKKPKTCTLPIDPDTSPSNPS